MKNLKCPDCGSNDINQVIEERFITVPFGISVAYKAELDTCRDCGADGDFGRVNDKNIEDAEKKANELSAVAILDDLTRQGITMSYFERSLRLPQRTTHRWKAGGVSHAGLALLRVVRTFPWVLDVADEDFDINVANRTLFQAATQIFSNAFMINTESPKVITGTSLSVVPNINMGLKTATGR